MVGSSSIFAVDPPPPLLPRIAMRTVPSASRVESQYGNSDATRQRPGEAGPEPAQRPHADLLERVRSYVRPPSNEYRLLNELQRTEDEIEKSYFTQNHFYSVHRILFMILFFLREMRSLNIGKLEKFSGWEKED